MGPDDPLVKPTSAYSADEMCFFFVYGALRARPAWERRYAVVFLFPVQLPQYCSKVAHV